MRAIIFLLGISLINAELLPAEKCDGVTFKGRYYEKDVLKHGLDRPYNLAVEYTTNNLYFSYTANSQENVFNTAYIDIDTKEFKIIKGMTNGFANAVDHKTDEVYLGGKGIFKFISSSGRLERFGADEIDIWSLYYKDSLYYNTFPGQELYVFEDEKIHRVNETEDDKVDLFIIDNEDYIFYTNYSGLFGVEKGSKESVEYNNTLLFRAMTADVDHVVYFATAESVYVANKKERTLENVATIGDIFGVAFDRDNNLVYADSDKIVRLKRSGKKCINPHSTTEASNN